jgi:hypothetical protein
MLPLIVTVSAPAISSLGVVIAWAKKEALGRGAVRNYDDKKNSRQDAGGTTARAKKAAHSSSARKTGRLWRDASAEKKPVEFRRVKQVQRR